MGVVVRSGVGRAGVPGVRGAGDAGRQAPLPGVFAPGVVTAPRIAGIDEWIRAVNRLLTDAAASKPLHDKVKAMDAWLAANPWHEAAAERERRRDELREELRRIENRLFDQAAAVSRMQATLPDAMRLGLEALTRMDLTPHVAQVWATAARESGKTGLMEVAEAARALLTRWEADA